MGNEQGKPTVRARAWGKGSPDHLDVKPALRLGRAGFFVSGLERGAGAAEVTMIEIMP
jgi:hypothetical protein